MRYMRCDEPFSRRAILRAKGSWHDACSEEEEGVNDNEQAHPEIARLMLTGETEMLRTLGSTKCRSVCIRSQDKPVRPVTHPGSHTLCARHLRQTIAARSRGVARRPKLFLSRTLKSCGVSRNRVRQTESKVVFYLLSAGAGDVLTAVAATLQTVPGLVWWDGVEWCLDVSATES